MTRTHSTRRRGWSKPLPRTPELLAMQEWARQMTQAQLREGRVPQWMREEYSKRLQAHHAQIADQKGGPR